jgi:thioredoxin 1
MTFMASDKVKIFTDENFEQAVLKANAPVLVDFWAEWCGPCLRLAPTIDAIAAEYEGRAIVGKLNVDESPNTPGRYGIRGIPTLLLFRDGQVVDQIVGLVDKSVVKKALDRVLG